MNKHRIGGLLLLVWAVWAHAIDVGDPAPPYGVHLAGGGEMTNSSQQHRVTILHFWASWCVPCREEMPRLETLYQRYHDQGLDIVAIDMDGPQDVSQARTMVSHFHFPWASASQAQVEGFGRIWRLPLSILIDRQGIVRQNAWAADDDHGLSEAELEAKVAPLIQSGVPVQALANKSAPPEVLDAKARATAPGQTVGVIYLTLRNDHDVDDALEGADSPVAAHILLHQTQTTPDGMSHMKHEYHLVIPAHGQTDLKPEGHHLMLENLKQPLVAGQTIPLDLYFLNAGKLHVEVPVVPLVPQ